MALPSIYKNVHFSGILYVIDINDSDQINYARKELHRLMNEDELRHISVLAIVFNQKRKKQKEEKAKGTIQPNGERSEPTGLIFNKEKRKKQLHDELDLESINKKIQIITEIFDVIIEKEERNKFMDILIRNINDSFK